MNKHHWQVELTQEEYDIFNKHIEDPQWMKLDFGHIFNGLDRTKRPILESLTYINMKNISHFSLEKLGEW